MKIEDEEKIVMRHLIDFGDLSRAEWEKLYQRTSEIIDHPADFMEVCKGKVAATLFFEPSRNKKSHASPTGSHAHPVCCVLIQSRGCCVSKLEACKFLLTAICCSPITLAKIIHVSGCTAWVVS